jgi:hypothetical protein
MKDNITAVFALTMFSTVLVVGMTLVTLAVAFLVPTTLIAILFSEG